MSFVSKTTTISQYLETINLILIINYITIVIVIPNS